MNRRKFEFFSQKKAMGITQVFIFIVVAITFAVIMIFGYQAIQQFIKTGEEVTFVQFKNDLESSVKEIYSDFGTVRQEEFHLPPQYERICLVDLEYDKISEELDKLCKLDPVACSVWQDAQAVRMQHGKPYEEVEENVFLTPPSPVKLKVYKVEIENGFLCPPINRGIFQLQMEGLGDRTKLSLPK
jgi:hypothetical protein